MRNFMNVFRYLHVTLSGAKGLYHNNRDSHLHLRAVQVSLRSE
jgi:hypothetical protein